jgi:hypothetical protein
MKTRDGRADPNLIHRLSFQSAPTDPARQDRCRTVPQSIGQAGTERPLREVQRSITRQVHGPMLVREPEENALRQRQLARGPQPSQAALRPWVRAAAFVCRALLPACGQQRTKSCIHNHDPNPWALDRSATEPGTRGCSPSAPRRRVDSSRYFRQSLLRPRQFAEEEPRIATNYSKKSGGSLSCSDSVNAIRHIRMIVST